MEEIEALVVLNHMCRLNGKKARTLLNHFGSALDVLGTPHLGRWQDAPEWKEDLERIGKEGVSLIPFTSPQYPRALLNLTHPPLMLYVKGNLKEEDSRAIAIVGTRECTLYGRGLAEQISYECATQGYTVISGLARGIDTSAHVGALRSGRTVAILGSGLSCIYPKENGPLAERIAEKGAVVSVLPMNTSPQKHYFPQRNVFVSALCIAALLVEAPLKSGALITASHVLSQGKKCFTLPGRVDMPSFKGNHDLLKKSKALLVENGFEMLSLLETGSRELGSNTRLRSISLSNLSPEEQKLIALLSKEETTIEHLAEQTEWPIPKLSALLMGLVLKEKIDELPGKIYSLTKS